MFDWFTFATYDSWWPGRLGLVLVHWPAGWAQEFCFFGFASLARGVGVAPSIFGAIDLKDALLG